MGLLSALRRMCGFGIFAGAALSSASCSEAADCDTSSHARSDKEQSSLGFSAQELLGAYPTLSSGLQWTNTSDWFSPPPSGATNANFTFQADGKPFESNSVDECSAYLGIPVTITLKTNDGAVEASATGQLEAFSLEHFRLKVAFDANDIGGDVAPTGGVDLVADIQVLGDAVEGTLTARRVRRTESSLSVTQEVVGTFTMAGELPDAGGVLDGAPSNGPSGIPTLLPPVQTAASDSGLADVGTADVSDADVNDAGTAAPDSGVSDGGSSVGDASADADAAN